MSSGAKTYVVSAPSGTGKTTLNRRLMSAHGHVQMSISYTARPKRPAETDGVHYHFVSNDEFRTAIARGDMLEYAEVFGTLYGTPRSEIERIHGLGKTALLEIDVQGWRQAKPKLQDAKSIFILPPSVAELWHRLESRGTESKEVRFRRLMTARTEIAAGDLYDFFIVNRELAPAYQELEDIIIHDRPGKVANAEGTRLCQALIAEFDAAPWLQALAREFPRKSS